MMSSMLTPQLFDMLKKLSIRAVSIVDLPTADDLKMVQRLTKMGYARDYGTQWGKRIPIHLRLWGITDSGKAVLEQQALSENQTRGQLGFQLIRKPPVSIKTGVTVRTLQPIKGGKASKAD